MSIENPNNKELNSIEQISMRIWGSLGAVQSERQGDHVGFIKHEILDDGTTRMDVQQNMNTPEGTPVWFVTTFEHNATSGSTQIGYSVEYGGVVMKAQKDGDEVSLTFWQLGEAAEGRHDGGVRERHTDLAPLHFQEPSDEIDLAQGFKTVLDGLK